MDKDTIITIVALLCIAVLGVTALMKGINGKLLTAIVGAICFIIDPKAVRNKGKVIISRIIRR